jgi:hypothetical protein
LSGERRDRSRSRSRSFDRQACRSNRSTKRRAASRSCSEEDMRVSRRTMFSGKSDPDGKGFRKNK